MARAKRISPFACKRADLDSSGSSRLQICLPESTDKNSGLVAIPRLLARRPRLIARASEKRSFTNPSQDVDVRARVGLSIYSCGSLGLKFGEPAIVDL